MIHISKPYIKQEEKDAVLRVLESGQIAQGREVRKFEEKFAAFIGVRHAIAVSSGTAALCIALLADGIGPGDEVITSPFTFIASANSIRYTGAKPVFIDIDPATFNMDPALIEASISPQTGAIMPVHLYGYPCEMDAIMDLASKHNLSVIEDACQAHGAAFAGRKVGTFGTGCFSLYATKNMTAGEGGMVTTDDAAIAEAVRGYRAHGTGHQYFHESLGYNFRMTDIQAAIGSVQLDRLEILNSKRRANADYLIESLHNVRGITLPNILDTPHYHVVHQFTIKVPQGRDRLQEHLEQRGVGSKVFYPLPVYQQPLYRSWGYSDHLPVTEKASLQVLSLPIHPGLEQNDLDTIIQAIQEFDFN